MKYKTDLKRKNINFDKYINKALPLISLENNKNATHRDLALYIKGKFPKIFNKFMASLSKIRIEAELKKFKGTLHDTRINLIIELLEARKNELLCL